MDEKRGRVRQPGGGRWPLVVTVLLFFAAIGTLIAPERLLGEGAESARLDQGAGAVRLSELLIAAAVVCLVLLLCGAIRRSSSPRFFANTVRVIIALGIAAVVFVAVQVATRFQEIVREDAAYDFYQDGAFQGLGVSATLFLFGCGLVGFSVLGARRGRNEPQPQSYEAAAAIRSAPPSFEPPPAPGRTAAMYLNSIPSIRSAAILGKEIEMRDTVNKDDGVAPNLFRGGWADSGPGAAETGVDYGPAQMPVPFIADGDVLPMPSPEELRAEIRRRIEARPVFAEEAKALLQLMASHDSGFAATLAKMPERQGIGGAVVASLLETYKGNIDLIVLTRAVSAALVFWPDKGPAASTIEDIALRLAEFSHDAAREFARAYALLGTRFSLQYSIKVVLQKYGISQSTFDSIRPEEGLTDGTIRGLLVQGRLDLLNEILRPFAIAILEKIGTVVPVYSVIENNHDRYVVNVNEFLAFLRKRNVIR